MKYIFDSIKIDEKSFTGNNKEKSKMYLVKISYKDLIDICGVGKVSINRGVDVIRAGKMKKYIRMPDSFYPPLIVATTKKNLVVYDDEKKQISIHKDRLEKQKDMLVIDGQHRYTSIKLLKEEDEESINNRYQSIYLIDNLNEFQQRKIFIDINNTGIKVSTGTKLRLDKNLINYISLSIVNNSEIIQARISMDGNQTKTTEKIPYKFIIRGNEKLLKEVDSEYEKNNLDIRIIDKMLIHIYKIWDGIFNIVNLTEENMYKVLTNEVFYTAVCNNIIDIFNEYIYYKVKNDEEVCKDEFNEKLDKIFDVLNRRIEDINKEYYAKNLNSSKQRFNEINDIISKYIKGGNNV